MTAIFHLVTDWAGASFWAFLRPHLYRSFAFSSPPIFRIQNGDATLFLHAKKLHNCLQISWLPR
jgi:hypothetical protein